MHQFNANSGRLRWFERIRKDRQTIKDQYPTPLHLFQQKGGRRGVIVEFKDRGADIMWEERGIVKNADYITILNYKAEESYDLISYMREKYPLQIRVTYHGQKQTGTVTQITKEHVYVEFDKGGEKQIEMLDFFAFGRRMDKFFPYGSKRIQPERVTFTPLILVCGIWGITSIQGE